MVNKIDPDFLLYGNRLAESEKALEKSDLSPKQKNDIHDFVEYLKAKGVSGARINRYIYFLIKLSKIINKPISKITPKDITLFLSQTSDQAEWTIYTNKNMIKTYLRYKFKIPSSQSLPIEYSELLKAQRPANKLTPNDLISPEEFVELTKNIPLKWKALFWLLYETGLRPEEALLLQMKDLEIGDSVIKVTVRFGKMRKKQQPRVVFAVRGFNVLVRWLEENPFKDDPNGYLFPANGNSKKGESRTNYVNRPMRWATVNKRLKTWGKERLGKNITLYTFRHTALTTIYSTLPTEIARRLAGHTAGSRNINVYVHLRTNELMNTYLTALGYKKKNDKNDVIGVRCPMCNRLNPVGALVCYNCGHVLSDKGAVKKMELLEKLEKVSALLDKIEKIQNSTFL